MKKLISLALVAALVLPACTPGGATRNDPLAGPYRVLGVKEIFADAPRGWWTGFEYEDDATWSDIRTGRKSGFSVHGRGKRVPVEV